MIRSFADRETERVFNRVRSPRLPNEIQPRALRKLQMLNAAADLRDLRIPPSNELEQLAGDRAGQHIIRINRQWRVCFRWDAGDAYEVEICDYH